MTGPARPARPPGCVVTYFPDVRIEGTVDIASANVSCAKSRDRCLEQLRDQACAVGADSIFLTSERSESMYIHMTARFAARAGEGPSP